MVNKEFCGTSLETNAVFTGRLSSGTLSTRPLFDDSLAIADTTYESTIFMPLPTCVGAESASLPRDTSCPDVATQTSLLLPSNDTKTNSPQISGNDYHLSLMFS